MAHNNDNQLSVLINWLRHLALFLGIGLVLPYLVHEGISLTYPTYHEYVKKYSNATGKDEEGWYRFIAASILGVAFISVGALAASGAAAAGFTLGGILTFIYGQFSYWYRLGTGIRFLMLLLVLFLLVYLSNLYYRRAAGK